MKTSISPSFSCLIWRSFCVVSCPLSRRSKKHLFQLEANHRLDSQRNLGFCSCLHTKHLHSLPFCSGQRGKLSRHRTHRYHNIHMHNLDRKLPDCSHDFPLHLDQPFLDLGKHSMLVRLSLLVQRPPSNVLEKRLPHLHRTDWACARVLDRYTARSRHLTSSVFHTHCRPTLIFPYGWSYNPRNEVLRDGCERHSGVVEGTGEIQTADTSRVLCESWCED